MRLFYAWLSLSLSSEKAMATQIPNTSMGQCLQQQASRKVPPGAFVSCTAPEDWVMCPHCWSWVAADHDGEKSEFFASLSTFT